MREIPPQLTPQLARHVGKQTVAKAPPYRVSTFRDLMSHVSRLAYANKDHLLFFRGQDRDYLNKARASTVYPSIYRGETVTRTQLDIRFDVLTSASRRLCDALAREQITGHQEVRKRRYIQWSILQHYQVCPTPLLDLTQSLRVAASFAHLFSSNKRPLVLVFAVPYLPNRVSVNSEYDSVVVRLLSICPPEALRPYFQDGYLAGTDEITNDYPDKSELDFNRVLIAKFILPEPSRFWGSGFTSLPENALFPDADKVAKICRQLRREVGSEPDPGRLGQLLQAWTDLENDIMTLARHRKPRVFSFREALSVLRRSELLTPSFMAAVDGLRNFRNRAVHQPRAITVEELGTALSELDLLQLRLQKLGR